MNEKPDAQLSADLCATAVRALVLYSLAEFQNGHVTTIRVTADGRSFSIADNGRGHSLDRTVDGTSYLRFIYSHFDYPFETGRSAPVQLQGIGMSLVNALCRELTLTVTKREETLQAVFRNGQLHDSHRTAISSTETGIRVSGHLHPHLTADGDNAAPLAAWLQSIQDSSPGLKLIFNGNALTPRHS